MADDRVDRVQPCPVCQSVASGGRIRLTDEGAELLMELLYEKRGAVLQARRLLKVAGAKTTVHDEQLDAINLLYQETKRTQQEMGWTNGEPQRTHA